MDALSIGLELIRSGDLRWICVYLHLEWTHHEVSLSENSCYGESFILCSTLKNMLRQLSGMLPRTNSFISFLPKNMIEATSK